MQSEHSAECSRKRERERKAQFMVAAADDPRGCGWGVWCWSAFEDELCVRGICGTVRSSQSCTKRFMLTLWEMQLIKRLSFPKINKQLIKKLK